jgi:AcrR family transcriptional regulator
VSRRPETAPGPSRADRRREAILDAAARIFAEKGYHETGIADIAGELGIGHGTVYRYFKNKDDIAAGVSDRAVRRLAEALLQESPTASDTLDEYRAQVERIIDRMFAALDDHPDELRFFHRHLLAVDAEMLDRAVDAGAVGIELYLANGVAKGFLRPDLDTRLTAQAIVAVLLDVIRRSLAAPPEQVLRRRWAAAAVALMFTGIQR